MANSGFQPGEDIVQVPREPNVRNPQLISGGGQLASGLGKFLDEIVGVGDTFFKNTIENKAKDQVEIVQNASNEQAKAILASQGTPEGIGQIVAAGSSAIPTQTPSAISAAADTASGWTAAKNMGKVNNTNYEAQMDLITRQIKRDYPGYRDFIDDTMAKLMGHTPANLLHRALDAQLQALGQAGANIDTRIAHSEDRLAQEGDGVRTNPEAMAIKASGNKEKYMDWLNSREADRNVYKMQTQAATARANQKVKESEAASMEGAQMFQVMHNNYLADFTHRLLSTQDPQAIAFRQTMDEMQSGAEQTPQRRQEMINTLRQIEAIHNQGFEQLVSKYGSIVPPNKMEEFRKNNRAYFEDLTVGISKHLPNFWQAKKDELEFRQNSNRNLMFKDSAALRTFDAIRHFAGDLPTNTILNNSRVLGPVEKQISDDWIKGMGTQVLSPNDAIQDLKRRLQGEPASSQIIDNTYKNFTDALSHKEIKPEAAKQFVEGLFSDYNRGFINNLPEEKKTDAYSKILSFGMIDRYQELYKEGKIDKAQLDKVLPWAVDNAATILTNKFKELNDFHRFSGNVNINYDNVNHRFFMGPASDKEKAATELQSAIGETYAHDIASGIDAYFESGANRNTQVAMHEINKVLNSLTYAAEKMGVDPERIAQETMLRARSTIGGPKQVAPNFHNAYTAFVNAAQKLAPDETPAINYEK